ncbi:helix-turn-helix domain-containing protein [Actinomadura sp. GC306]|uniref:helix-turn-helix domain-containing protein n=1 Tax=Actinomadura sp. GC306 TaxID=2530367 RepID=UPI0010471F11|nr:helix-turn-helix domain-containing protein [Actinomadura sp. GC306]TDC64210.1 helix-turn-helix domain-containing protein [Actinomadura sp. GC306]
MHDPTTRQLARRLLGSGLTLAEVHRQTGVPLSTLGYWRKNPDTGAGSGRSLCPRCHGRELNGRRYSYLLGLYLGDGHIAKTHREGVYRLEIACADSWPGLIDEAAEAVAEVMPGHKVGRRKVTGCTNVGVYSKHLPCLFPQHGPGRKHDRKIELAGWQRKIVDECTEEFVRGLIHSDGCRVINRIRRPSESGDRWYEYPRYNFSNASLDIQRLFTDALDRLGIAWTQMNRRNLSVAKREAVARLDEFVGAKY